MTRTRWAICLSSAIFCFATIASADSRVECDKVPSKYVPPAVHYCALLPASSDTSTANLKPLPVLYFLHGLGQNSQSLFDDGMWSLVDELQRKKLIRDFVIITPDADRSFYINSK